VSALNSHAEWIYPSLRTAFGGVAIQFQFSDAIITLMKQLDNQHEINGYSALVWKEGSLFVARAVEVEVASQGKSSAEALKNLGEALDLYFADDDASSNKVKPFSMLELHQIPGKYNYA
jgi:predicted RNase H-like HicB family nuclease